MEKRFTIFIKKITINCRKKVKMHKCLILILISIIVSGCSQSGQKDITYVKIKGSDTMLILTRLWAQEYMNINKNVSIYTEGGGSGSGIKSLIEGSIDICASSRPMKAFEVRQLAEAHSRLGISFYVAKDALSVYLNPENPVGNLTLDHLEKIYTGKISNWSEVGGDNQPIFLVSRSPNSGTYSYFKEHVLNGNAFLDSIHVYNTTNAIIKSIETNIYSIGYGGIAYGESIQHAQIDGITATVENVRENIYPISRYLYFYTIDSPKGEVKNFIDWVLSHDGQTVVAKSGYIPLWTLPNK